jgi:hypothetical protein
VSWALKSVNAERRIYKEPRRNTTKIPSFRLGSRWSFHIMGIGRSIMRISITKSEIASAYNIKKVLMHFASNLLLTHLARKSSRHADKMVMLKPRPQSMTMDIRR